MTATDLPTNSSCRDLPILDTRFSAINWQAPWLCHLSQFNYLSQVVTTLSHQATAAVQADNQSGIVADIVPPDIVAKILNTAMTQQMGATATPPQTKPTLNNQAHALRFVSQDALPEGAAYESFIATTGNIPTRDNLHDLFNGSIWLTFPKTKALLNYYHMLEIDRHGISASRGCIRDTITVFDENGAILVTAEPSIGEALMDFDWQASLVTPRAKWDNLQPLTIGSKPEAKAAVYIFGHALLEKLIQPRKPLCAHSVVMNVTADFFALPLSERLPYLDKHLADYMHHLLSQNAVTPRNLAPLPILGVPHFWPANREASFYEDSAVFRRGRQRKK